MLSKLCKENNPEACKDCLSIRCSCNCHQQDEDNWDDFEPHGDKFPDED